MVCPVDASYDPKQSGFCVPVNLKEKRIGSIEINRSDL